MDIDPNDPLGLSKPVTSNQEYPAQLPSSIPVPQPIHQNIVPPSASLISTPPSRQSRAELEDRIIVLEQQLMEKQEELRVALRWRNNAETKLEDLKDRLSEILGSI